MVPAMTARLLVLIVMCSCSPAMAGPPYVTDDPAPTEYRHFEVYGFTGGTDAAGGTGGAAGIDFNYGAAPDLQLTVVVPWEYDVPAHGAGVAGIGNIELAAKYRFLHQEDFGWDVAIFPRIFLPSVSHDLGDGHASLLVPLWVGKDFGDWSTFGGGGCALSNGGGSQDYCLAGWALTRRITQRLRVGAEIYRQTADTKGGLASAGVGAGAVYDISEISHLTVSVGPGIENAPSTGRLSWYVAILSTF